MLQNRIKSFDYSPPILFVELNSDDNCEILNIKISNENEYLLCGCIWKGSIEDIKFKVFINNMLNIEEQHVGEDIKNCEHFYVFIRTKVFILFYYLFLFFYFYFYFKFFLT
jgi:hypothetical protein